MYFIAQFLDQRPDGYKRQPGLGFSQTYHVYPKYSDKLTCANSGDQDQSSQSAIQSASKAQISLLKLQDK